MTGRRLYAWHRYDADEDDDEDSQPREALILGFLQKLPTSETNRDVFRDLPCECEPKLGPGMDNIVMEIEL